MVWYFYQLATRAGVTLLIESSGQAEFRYSLATNVAADVERFKLAVRYQKCLKNHKQ